LQDGINKYLNLMRNGLQLKGASTKQLGIGCMAHNISLPLVSTTGLYRVAPKITATNDLIVLAFTQQIFSSKLKIRK
jgi:hypothetical protein